MSKNESRVGWWSACCAGVLMACAPQGAPVPPRSSVLGRAGGLLEVSGVGTLQVAAGALPGDVTVQAAVVEAPVAPPGRAVSPVLELTPHGTRFAIPARVTLQLRERPTTSAVQVWRLADASDTRWEPVGGARVEGLTVVFDTPGFSYYVVTDGQACELVAEVRACVAGCECCGGASCVDVSTDVRNCGACGVACDGRSFCSSAQQCLRVGPQALCANARLYVVQGQIPDLTVVNVEQTTDGVSAARLASLIATACPGLAVSTVSQAAEGLLNPCTDAPLVGGGTTLLVTGGSFAQRVAGYLEDSVSPIFMEESADELTYTFHSRGGAVLTQFPRASLSDSHDYFVIAFERDPGHGAQVLQVYGVGWEGTPAATWYFEHRFLPAVQQGTVGWSSYALIEWTDDGDGVKGEGDTFTVLAQDIP